MTDSIDERAPENADLFERLQDHTPARIFTGRAGEGYRTSTLLDLRADHAFALDAVHVDVDLARDLGQDMLAQFGVFEVASRAATREIYLTRPDLGRRLSDEARRTLAARCAAHADFQAAIADGLSSAAVARQAPALLPLLRDACEARGWTFGQVFFVRNGRVGLLNDIGDVLQPRVVVLLIGERPGLATAESLSAYMAHEPKPDDTDARRNLIANIHARGVPPAEAAARIIRLAERMRAVRSSGVDVKEGAPAVVAEPRVLPQEPA